MKRSKSEALGVSPAGMVLFYSAGNHFDAAVRELKRRFPRARLTAVGPMWRTESLHRAGLIDNRIEVSRDKLRLLKDFKECVRILAAIRHDRCDLFVTIYDSPALNVLHSLSGCRDHAVFDVRGALYPLSISRFYVARVIFGEATRAFLGGLTYAVIRTTFWVWGSLKGRGRAPKS